MNILQKLLTIRAKGSRTGEKLKSISKIVIHYVGNAGSSAEANRNYFENQGKIGKQVSAHYIVGLNGEIVQCIPDNEVAFHAGEYTTNRNSIGIEVCHPDSTGKFTEITINALSELVHSLMLKYNISAENVIRHYDVTGKKCPLYYIDNNRWNELKSRITSKINLKYEVHIQNKGWQTCKENGELAGTTGECLRIEAIKIYADINIQYRVHMQDKGWSEWFSNGCMAGSIGESRRIEAIEIISSKNEIKAQAHIQDIGWQEETKGTHIKIGTEGRALRLEALKLEFV